MRTDRTRWGWTLLALGLSACAAPAPRTVPHTDHAPSLKVAQVTRHLRAYMAAHYLPAQLPLEVRTALARAGSASVAFDRLVVTRQFVRHDSARDTSTTARVTDTFIPIGHGYLQDREHIWINTLPVALNLNLSYLGLLSLEHQHLNERSGSVRAPQRLQQLSGLTPGIAHPQPGHRYHMTLRWLGPRTEETCIARRHERPASRLLAALPGRALVLLCTIERGGIVRSRIRMVYLSAYRIFLILGRDGASFTVRGRIQSITAG
ncbi:MAG: hypothetical protein ACP5P4_02390 [Steroidobacteraceae bacterium]